MVKAQEYLNQKYLTKEIKEKVIELDISNQNLERILDLSEFINLEELNCSNNQLTELNTFNCSNLEMLVCHNNLLSSLDLSSNSKLEMLNVGDNNFFEQDLSFLKHLVNLEIVVVGNRDKKRIKQEIYNRFYGSLEYLKNMNKLECLDIRNSDINTGIEYLSESLEEFICSSKEKSNSKVREIYELFSNEKGIVEVDDYYVIKNFGEKIKKFNKQKSLTELGRKDKNIRGWKNIHINFTEELQKEWEDKDFAYEECKEWIDIGLGINDADYAYWLKEIKKVDSEWVLNHGNNNKESREEYRKFLESQVKIEKLKYIKKYIKFKDMVSIRKNILLIGSTGQGKSTLGNVIIGKENKLEENEFGTSGTRDIQKVKFEIGGNKYQVIDTVGIHDTEMPLSEVLFMIAKGCKIVEDGINQVLFIEGGKFTSGEVEAYNILRKVFFDEGITSHTTIVRTKFVNFRNPNKCKRDIQLLLENEIISEVIRSCDSRVIHVDNPPINVEDEEEKKNNRKKREISKSILLKHLEMCTENYKPRSLDEINKKINEYVIEKEEGSLKEELDKIKIDLTSVKNKLESDGDLTKELIEQLKNLEDKKENIEGKILDNNRELVEKAMKEMLREKGLFEFMGKKLDNVVKGATRVMREELHHLIEVNSCSII